VLILVVDALGDPFEVTDHLLVRLPEACRLRCLHVRRGDARQILAGFLELPQTSFDLLPEADDQLDLRVQRRHAVAACRSEVFIQAAKLLHLRVELRLQAFRPGFQRLP